jgi:hypothetical protein
MPGPPYRALRVVLGFLSLFMAIGGVVLIFSSKALVLRLFRHPPEAEISTLFLFTLKEMGGSAVMLAVMVFLAARDPGRNVAIIDALAVGLCILAITPLVSHRMLDIQRIYPGHLIWGRSVIRLALAGIALLLEAARTRLETSRPFLRNRVSLKDGEGPNYAKRSQTFCVQFWFRSTRISQVPRKHPTTVDRKCANLQEAY